ncbi:MAG: arginine--tRNA ligase [bacterium]|nr:arginine--tRNA ligase [bacterium]
MAMDWLKNKIKGLYVDVDFDVLAPPDEKMGDYSINLAFVLAKKESRNPKEVGQELVGQFLKDEEFKKYFDKIELAGNGFINFHLSRDFLQKQLKEIHKQGDSFGKSKEGNNKTIIVEYSSPNIAKPMHIGHLRSTIIGDALANIYETLGYKVIRWNFIGDWGTQFGKLIAAFKIWDTLPRDTVQDILKLYIKFHEAVKDNPELDDRGQEEFAKLEAGDKENRKTWERIKQISVTEFDAAYQQLNVKDFNITKGESDYEKDLKSLVESLNKKGITKESEGALIIELDNLPPAMLRKSDGATLYVTRDIASLDDRIKNYNPTKILYVVANQQALHFEQLFAIAQKLGWTNTELTHVKFGMVLGEDGKKLATREGKVVPLQEVIDKLTVLALNTVKEKSHDLSDQEVKKIAEVVALGALKYNDLKQHPYSDITFDWNAMLDLGGNSGPYLQYTYARLLNIIKKVGNRSEGDASLLIEPSERKIMRKLLDFPEAVIECSKLYTLNALALYLYELASVTNRFYEQIRIVEDQNNERRNARLLLVETTAAVLKRGLNLLGIETLERI